MPPRKKNQNPKFVEGEESGENLTADLEEQVAKNRHVSRAVVGSVLTGLLAGLVGGTAGSIYVVPWYQEKVLAEKNEIQTRIEREQIVLDEESAIIEAVEKVNPAVVSIVITKDLPKFEQFGSPFDDFFFSIPSGEIERQRVGAGSGFIITEDGMVVTNRHVVADTNAEYTVVTKDGEKFPAKVVATDPFNDLAVVKIEKDGLPTVKLGDSDRLKLGQRVIAIGNALGEFQNTVTTGVVSGMGRNIVAGGGSQTEKLSQLIQTDAAINLGNSGGPLVNLEGEVIGVNTAVSQMAQLIGFAIPIDQVKKVITDVKEFGRVRRPFLGVRYVIVTESFAKINNLARDYGALVVRGDTSQELAVIPGSPADQADLQSGDIILELDGKRITIENQLADLLRDYSPGDRVILRVFHDGEERTVPITLGEAQ